MAALVSNLKSIDDLDQYLKLTKLEGREKPSLINCSDNVDIHGNSVTNISKLEIPFGKVSGDFEVWNNALTSMEGFPKIVGGNFSCWKNQITNFKGSPEIVDGDYDCSKNPIKTLNGINKHVKSIKGEFICTGLDIDSGFLQVLLIKDLTRVDFMESHPLKTFSFDPLIGNIKTINKIINKYLLNGSSTVKGIKALYVCEDELIRAGFESFC